jgi:hypothetical protein
MQHRQLARPMSKYGGNIKMDLGGVVFEGLDFSLVQWLAATRNITTI